MSCRGMAGTAATNKQFVGECKRQPAPVVAYKGPLSLAAGADRAEWQAADGLMALQGSDKCGRSASTAKVEDQTLVAQTWTPGT